MKAGKAGATNPGAIILALAAVFFLRCAPSYAQTAAGTVTTLIGTATIQRAGSAIQATTGMPVQTADQVSVAKGGKVTITLSDGSILEVGSSSSIIVDQQLLDAGGGRSSTRVRLLAGILRSVAKHSSQGNLPNFEVHTPNAILAARGTTFDTEYSEGQRRFGYGDTTRFTDERTHKGTVGARNAAKPLEQEVLVPAGYEITIAGDNPPSPPGPAGMTGIPMSGTDALTATEPGPAGGVPPPPPPVAPAPPPQPGPIGVPIVIPLQPGNSSLPHRM